MLSFHFTYLLWILTVTYFKEGNTGLIECSVTWSDDNQHKLKSAFMPNLRKCPQNIPEISDSQEWDRQPKNMTIVPFDYKISLGSYSIKSTIEAKLVTKSEHLNKH